MKLLAYAAVLVLLLAPRISGAQQAPPPDVRTPQAAAGISGLAYLDWLDKPGSGQIPLLWNQVIQMQTLTSRLPGDESAIGVLQIGKADAAATSTSITALTNQLNALTLQVSALQQRLDSLQPPSSVKDLEFSKCVAGQPISGVWQGVTIAPGFWTCAAVPAQPNALAPAADGQPLRSFTLPAPATITSITFLTTNARTAGITLTPDNAPAGVALLAQDAAGAAVVNQPVTINKPAGLTGTVFKVSGAGSGSIGPDLRILDVKYQ